MERQVHFARAAGCDGVVALGVFGEAAHLSLAEQRAVAATVVGAADGLPTVLGVSGRATAVAAEQAVNALEGAQSTAPSGSSGEGAADPVRLMVQVNSGTAPDVVRHLHALHAETGVGIVLQDFPTASGVHIRPAEIVEVLRECPFVAAVKAESPPTPPRSASSRSRPTCPCSGVSAGWGSSTSSPWARLER